jgi:hypothetical protein
MEPQRVRQDAVENTAGSPAGSPRVTSRARVRTGQLLPGLDGRGWWMRRAKAIIAELISDLGGVDNTSVAERAICRRIAVLEIELERLEHGFATLPDNAAPPAAAIDLYQRTSGGWRRLLETIGIQRRARTVETTLDDILNEEAAE